MVFGVQLIDCWLFFFFFWCWCVCIYETERKKEGKRGVKNREVKKGWLKCWRWKWDEGNGVEGRKNRKVVLV